MALSTPSFPPTSGFFTDAASIPAATAIQPNVANDGLVNRDATSFDYLSGLYTTLDLSEWAPTSTNTVPPSSISVAPSLSSASGCLSSWDVYEEGYSTYTTDTSIPAQTTVTLTSVKNAAPTSLHTLCDGYPRAPSGVSEYRTFNQTVTTATAWSGVTNASTNTITTAAPTCSVAGDQCFALGSDFAYYTTMQSPHDNLINPDVGPCKNFQYCDRCQVRARSVELFYWPVTTGSPLCTGNSSSSTATATATASPDSTITAAPDVATVVTRGITMTSPSVYLSFDYVVGIAGALVNGQTTLCGHTTSHLVVPIPPASLSSIRTVGAASDGSWVSATSSFDFADLNTVPADVYRGMSKCWTTTNSATGAEPTPTNVCHTIFDDYAPRLVIPDAVRDLVPLWKNCDACLEGVIDPPIPLKTADSLLKRTLAPAAAVPGETAAVTPVPPVRWLR
ncbi:hypothetical protein BKA80DRAFT_284794 [Phyllosticta citrichinensis]